MRRIGVVGAGAWGTALAVLLADDAPVTLWARSPVLAETIAQTRVNAAYLPSATLPDGVAVTSDPAALEDCDALLLVTPAQAMRPVLASIRSGDRPLLLCSKGIEAGTRRLMSEVAAELRPHAPVAVLSGPTFAHEVAAGLPTAVTLAAGDAALAVRLAERIARPGFRPYLSDDLVGAEIGGAVKNVLAIAAGVVAGAGLGRNAAAALIARGFAEMLRFGLARGAQAETLSGLSGLGDLVLTCASDRSRNFALGLGLGRGERAAALLADRTTVAEGAHTAPVLAEAARAAGIDMPITDAVCDLVGGHADVGTVIGRLLARPLGAERR